MNNKLTLTQLVSSQVEGKELVLVYSGYHEDQERPDILVYKSGTPSYGPNSPSKNSY